MPHQCAFVEPSASFYCSIDSPWIYIGWFVHVCSIRSSMLSRISLDLYRISREKNRIMSEFHSCYVVFHSYHLISVVLSKRIMSWSTKIAFLQVTSTCPAAVNDNYFYIVVLTAAGQAWKRGASRAESTVLSVLLFVCICNVISQIYHDI